MKILFTLAIASVSLLSAGTTTPLFQPGSSNPGPFPTDSLSVPDSTQKTGRRINLPIPAACSTNPTLSDCTNTLLLNQLDGFSVNPRVTACFSAAVNVNTLTGAIQMIPVTTPGPAIALNQILWDPAGKCVYGKPDQVLREDSQYLLVVAGSPLDSSGQKIKENSDFKDCLKNKSGTAYCAALSNAVQQVGGAASGDILSASLFTTLSATDWLEKARRFVDTNELPIVLPAGLPSLFSLPAVKDIEWYPQDQTGQNTHQQIPVSALSGVNAIAFGFFLSPNFINTSGPLAGSISVTPTNQPIQAPVPVPLPGNLPPIPGGYVPVSFHVFLPNGTPPAGGFPVVIYGHGLSDSQFGAPTFIASTLASQGYATLAMEIVGHGFGPAGYVQITNSNGSSSFVATPGRGIAFSTGPISSISGCILPGP